METPLKAGIITQARMTSTRLPGKIMLEASGKPVLQYHVERLQQSGLPVIIATTTNSSDDEVAEFATSHQLGLYRGDEENVLSRFYGAAQAYQLDIIIRVTSDCPLIDGKLVKMGLQRYLEDKSPQIYLSNSLQRDFPRGMDFEIFSFSLLEEAFLKATRREDREHVTPYINQNRSGDVIIRQFRAESDKSHYRLTLDTPDDWRLLEKLIHEYDASRLSYRGIIALLDAHPELANINAHIEQKKLEG